VAWPDQRLGIVVIVEHGAGLPERTVVLDHDKSRCGISTETSKERGARLVIACRGTTFQPDLAGMIACEPKASIGIEHVGEPGRERSQVTRLDLARRRACQVLSAGLDQMHMFGEWVRLAESSPIR
jgi:hypothetical protein